MEVSDEMCSPRKKTKENLTADASVSYYPLGVDFSDLLSVVPSDSSSKSLKIA